MGDGENFDKEDGEKAGIKMFFKKQRHKYYYSLLIY